MSISRTQTLCQWLTRTRRRKESIEEKRGEANYCSEFRQTHYKVLTPEIHNRGDMDLSMAPKEFVRLIFMSFCLLPGLAIEETQSQKLGILVVPSNFVEQYATLLTDKGVYRDATAKLLVYGVPEIKFNQTSAAFLQFSSKSGGNDNLIEAGWHVAPHIYNDSKTHFFVRFLGKKGRGCYNLYCKGFVRESSSRITPGNTIKPLSTYNGPQYSITVWLTRNVYNGNWEVYRKKRDGTQQLIGYWPVALFDSLSNHAEQVAAGGYVDYDKGDTNPPPMGSGHFASEGYQKAAGLLLTHQKNGVLYTLSGNVYTSRKDCYTIDGSKKGNTYSFFGGPAGCKG